MASAVEKLAAEDLVPGLRRECPCKGVYNLHMAGKPYCKRRGWTLIPEAEQMGVLVNWQVEQPGMWTVSFQSGRVELFNVAGNLYVDKNEDRTEALANTILEALEVT